MKNLIFTEKRTLNYTQKYKKKENTMVINIIKRDGRIVEFNEMKIKAAIRKANNSVEEKDRASIQDIANIVYNISKMEKESLTVEEIQTEVEDQLMDLGYKALARSYIIYRNERSKARNQAEALLSYKNVVENYTKLGDWRVKENASVSYSVGGLILSNSGAIVANYWLSEVYPKDIADAHRNADIHLHDLSMLTAYCAGWSIKQLIQEGLGGVPGKIASAPAKHLGTLCNQMVNFIGVLQNEWAGAQAFSSFDTYLAPFVKVDNLSYKETKQAIQSFVYGVNTPSRWGTQAPFSNITLDWEIPDDMAELQAIVGGEEMDFKYKDCKKEMDMINKAFIEVMIEGDANGRSHSYPMDSSVQNVA